jgi:hypothetical protein
MVSLFLGAYFADYREKELSQDKIHQNPFFHPSSLSKLTWQQKQ